MKKKLIISILLTTSIFSIINISNTHAAEISSTATPVATSTIDTTTSTIFDNFKEYNYKGFIYNIDKNNNITITKYEGTETSVIIPDEIDGKLVTSIYPAAFDNTNIKSLTLGKNISILANSFLNNCTKLKEINVNPDNKKYTSIDGVLYTKYRDNLVKYPSNKDLTNFSIPDYVHSIWPFAFSNCNNLTSLTILSNVEDVSKYAFYMCNGLKEVNLLTDLNKVKGDSKFYYCKNIETINTSYFLALFASEAKIDSIRKNTFIGSNNLTTLNDADGNNIMTLEPIKKTEVKTSTDTLSDIDEYSSYGGSSTMSADTNNLLITFLCTLGSLLFIKSYKKRKNI